VIVVAPLVLFVGPVAHGHSDSAAGQGAS
jgi:hypothetical protein